MKLTHKTREKLKTMNAIKRKQLNKLQNNLYNLERKVIDLDRTNQELNRQLNMYGKLDIFRQPGIDDCVRVQVMIDAEQIRRCRDPLFVINDVFNRLRISAIIQLLKYSTNHD